MRRLDAQYIVVLNHAMSEREDKTKDGLLGRVSDSVPSADVNLTSDLRVRAVVCVARCEEFVDAKQAAIVD